MRSSKLWVAIMPSPSAAIHRNGSHTIKAIATMLQPKIQITPAWPQGTKPQAKSMIVNSSNTSQRPRVKKNHETCCTVLPRLVARNAPVPARKANTGAQKWVRKRAKKSAPEVCATSSGAKRCYVMKSRAWSNAIRTMTSPRKISTETKRGAWTGRIVGFVVKEVTAGDVAVTICLLSSHLSLWHSSIHGSGWDNSGHLSRCQKIAINHADFFYKI